MRVAGISGSTSLAPVAGWAALGAASALVGAMVIAPGSRGLAGAIALGCAVCAAGVVAVSRSRIRAGIAEGAEPRHGLLLATIGLLPFAYVPHEIVRSGPSLTYVVFGLVLLLGIKYRALAGPVGPVDLAVWALTAFTAVRLLVISPIDGDGVPAGMLGRELGAILSGLILFRMARRAELRPVMVRGLQVALAVMLAIEVYQLLAGLPRLISLGYDEGFYYFTRAGDYRPFGAFRSPTVFGAYLAMVGIFVLLSARRRAAPWILVAVGTGLVLTQTRSAWLGFSLALVVVFLGESSHRRSRAILAALPLAWVGTLLTLLHPQTLGSVWARAASISDLSFYSNASRITLWDGVVRAVEHGGWVAGLGSRSFVDMLFPRIGPVAFLGHPHSNYIQELFRYGVVGLALFVALLVALLVELRRGGEGGRGPLYGAGLAALVVFAVDSIFDNSLSSLNFLLTLFLLVGLGTAALTAGAAVEGQTRVPEPADPVPT